MNAASCQRCMGTGYSDYAGFAQDLCAHGAPDLQLAHCAGGAPTMIGRLNLPDDKILTAMKCRPSGAMTYVICSILALEHGYRGLKTSAVLSRLKRMERAGIVERVSSSYAAQLCWRVCA
ncbi:Lrp/AsnC family transcriptional regulator [Novosphingobium resinovorum]|uniref:Lrp/AsnC family transcriptional regulator n=1 Tax=Novosphingobium resinovorum TaxID=158500 RepID=UPI002ED4F997|nr:Lrp/AsnC family transcriptional regulator [Novosphingobium resinovorum]